jgi:hypothetical protein
VIDRARQLPGVDFLNVITAVTIPDDGRRTTVAMTDWPVGELTRRELQLDRRDWQ